MEENNFIEQDNYSNEQILSSQLPTFEDLNFESISKSAMYVDFIVIGIIFLIVLLASSMTILLVEEVKPYAILILGGILLLMAAVFYIEWKSFKYRGFALRELDLLFKSGWIWKSTTIVPFNRVQHIEIHQGPIDKLFELSTLNIFTAGGSSSDLEIDGLTPQQAANIKAFIISKTNKNNVNDESE
jgi:hypothetical protein